MDLEGRSSWDVFSEILENAQVRLDTLSPKEGKGVDWSLFA